MDNLAELLEEQLKDLYSAENQLLKALPKMAKAATSDELRSAFETHTEQTRVHVERLAKVAEKLGIKPTGKVCAAMKGLVEEGKEVLEEDGHDSVIDAALIAAAQRVEHYEMAAYGTVKAIATVLGHDDIVAIFDKTLKEEEAADQKLTDVAESSVYPNAPLNDDEPEEEEETEVPAAKKSAKKAATASGKAGKAKR